MMTHKIRVPALGLTSCSLMTNDPTVGCMLHVTISSASSADVSNRSTVLRTFCVSALPRLGVL